MLVQKVFAQTPTPFFEKIRESKWYEEAFEGFKFERLFTEGGTIGGIISALLPYLFWAAGLILFGVIIVSGFQFLTSAGDPKKTAEAKGRLTSAVIGFLVVFLSWWLIQIIEVIFDLKILGN